MAQPELTLRLALLGQALTVIDPDARLFVFSLVNHMQPKNSRYSGFSGFSRL
jgi:hypothetical protein